MLPIIASVLGVFVIIGVGATCRHWNWLTREADRSLTNLTTRVLLPLYFVNKILSIGVTTPDSVAGDPTSTLPLWFTPLIAPSFGFVTTVTGFGIALLFARRVGPFLGIVTESTQRAFALCVGICNYGYIPYPLAERFYPDAMIELILHNVGVEMALWSIGILIISSGRTDDEIGDKISEQLDNQPDQIDNAEVKQLVPWKRVLFSGPLLAVVIATVLRVSGAAEWIPLPISFAISKIAGCAIPMGLMLCGAIIVDYISDLMRGPRSSSSLGVIGSAITIRQIIMPVLMLGSTRLLIPTDSATLLGESHLLEVMTLQAAMPSAIFPIVLVRLYGRDTRTAIEVLVSTSVAGIIAIPVWLTIGAWWLG